MDSLRQDIRYGVRVLRKSPGFSALIVFIVALGVGAAATIFSIVEKSLLWKENPNVDRWIAVRPFFPRQNLHGYRFSSPEYFDFRQLTDVFEHVGAISGFSGTVYIGKVPEFVGGTYVTADMIPMTAIPPMLGRAFTAEDDRPGAPKTTVLTYEFWQHRLHGEAGILGKDIRIDDDHYTVIGVMPPHYVLWGGELYVPFQLDPADRDRANRRIWVSALIRRGFSEKQVNARLDQLARTWERDYRATNPEYEGLRLSTWNVKEAVIAGVRPALVILIAAVALIVLISCANIGNLLLARASGRRREMALRAAIGAPRLRIIRQLLTESLLLSLAGGAVGVLLAIWGVPAAIALVPTDQLPHSELIHLDSGAVVVALAISTFMGVAFGLVPALYSSGGDLAHAVREGGLQSGASRRGAWARSALVVSQIALAMVVLSGAGLMIRTYRELLRVDFGYNPQNVITAQLVLPATRYPTGQRITAFYRELIARIDQIPGVAGAAITTGRPLMDRQVDVATQDFYLAGHQGDKDVPNANFRVVSPEYFKVAGVRLLRGRSLSEADTEQTEPVAVINETMAKLYWPHQDPIGQSIRLGNQSSRITSYGSGAEADASVGRTIKIVGLVADARQVRAVEVPVRQEIFFPTAQRAQLATAVSLMVRSRLSTDRLTDAVRHAVGGVDPDRPIFDVITLERAVSDSFGPKRMATVLLGFFALVAVTLASVGIYAIMAYAVAQRTRDIGIRMALGARPSDVLRMVVGEGWRLALLGLVGGIGVALAATRAMRSLVFDVSTTDPLTFLATGGLLAAIALLACYVPARRATRIDPVIALRQE